MKGKTMTEAEPNLPSVEECRTFLATINKGRIAIDLEPLEFVDFDGAMPNHDRCCLSATNLFALAGYRVGQREIGTRTPWDQAAIGEERDPRVKAICVPTWDGTRRGIPDEILAVTHRFDACARNPERLAALRARMVTAGVVAP